MKQSKYLITAATGATGSEAIRALLANGQQDIRAFVHREDERLGLLRMQGIEVAVGNLLDFHAVKMALQGVNRAYFCFPIMPGIVEAAAQFAQAAYDNGLFRGTNDVVERLTGRAPMTIEDFVIKHRAVLV